MYTTVQELIDSLNKIENKNLPVFGIVSSSGTSYELTSAYSHKKGEYDNAGPICDLDDGAEVCIVSLN